MLQFPFIHTGIRQLDPENRLKVSQDMTRFNIRIIKLLNIIMIFLVPGFIIQTIFLPKIGVHDQLTPYYIIIFSILLLVNVTSYLILYKRRDEIKNKKLFIYFYLILQLTFTMGLTFLDLHYGQELSLYIINIMFLSSFTWFTQKEYLFFTSYSFLLLLLSYIILGITKDLPLINAMPGLAYYFVALIFYINIFNIRMENFITRITLENQYQMIATESTTDPLTGLSNRRHMKEDFEEELNRCQISNKPCSVLLIDIDHFKKVNDSYGHIRGDLVLKEFAQVLQETTDSNENIYRYGGEAFIILLPNIIIEDAYILAEHIRKSLFTHDFTKVRWAITTSIGIAQSTPETTVEDLISVAGRRLYFAKENGRDKVIYK